MRAAAAALTSALIARATSSRGSRSGVRRLFFLSSYQRVGLLLGVGRLGPEELGDVVEHEALALGVLQRAAVAAHALGHQDAAHAGRPDHPGRVELDALHVDQVGAGVAAPARWPSPVYSQEFEVIFQALPMPPVASTTALALKTHELAALAPVAERARDPVAVLEQALDVALHVDVDALVRRRAAGACGSSRGRCGRRRGPGARSGGRRSRAAGCRPSLVRSNSAPHSSSSSTRSGASWAWSWAMRQLFSSLPPRMVSRKWTCQLSSGHTLPSAAAMPRRWAMSGRRTTGRSTSATPCGAASS